MNDEGVSLRRQYKSIQSQRSTPHNRYIDAPLCLQGMLEEVSVADVVTIAVPTVVGVGVIGLLTLLAFWLGSGQQRSYEEAMARATKEAEKVISREREQHSPRQTKRKRPKKKKPAEENEPPVPLLKPILKNSSSKPQNVQPERSPQKLVEFQLDSPPRHKERPPPTNPPTPHPGKQPWFNIETPKMEDLSTTTPTKPAPSKPTPPPAQKPVPIAAQKPPSQPLASKVADTSGTQKRSRAKTKQPVTPLGKKSPVSRLEGGENINTAPQISLGMCVCVWVWYYT